MKQNERDKLAVRLFKNRQKKQLKILNYNQFRTKMTLVCEIKDKKVDSFYFFSYPLDIFIHLRVVRLNNLPRLPFLTIHCWYLPLVRPLQDEKTNDLW